MAAARCRVVSRVRQRIGKTQAYHAAFGKYVALIGERHDRRAAGRAVEIDRQHPVLILHQRVEASPTDLDAECAGGERVPAQGTRRPPSDR